MRMIADWWWETTKQVREIESKEEDLKKHGAKEKRKAGENIKLKELGRMTNSLSAYNPKGAKILINISFIATIEFFKFKVFTKLISHCFVYLSFCLIQTDSEKTTTTFQIARRTRGGGVPKWNQTFYYLLLTNILFQCSTHSLNSSLMSPLQRPPQQRRQNLK